MRSIVSASELARRLGEVLGRVRFRGESFVIERHGVPIARIGPLPGASPVSVRDALVAWRGASPSDTGFGDDLERVGAADRPPGDPWAS